MDKFSQVGNQEIAAIEEIYASYLADQESVDPSWKNFFAGFEFARKNYADQKSLPHDEKIDKEKLKIKLDELQKFCQEVFLSFCRKG